MYRLRYSLLAASILVLMVASGVRGADMFPLEATDTSSPRATMESFLYYTKAFTQAMHASDTHPTPHRNLFSRFPREAEDAMARAIRCLDLSAIPPSIIEDVSLESVLKLREILDRIPLPDSAEIPGSNDVKQQSIVNWRIPHSELMIGKVTKGEHAGDFLFTPETIAQLDEYYSRVEALPCKDSALQGLYEKYFYSPGWMIPLGIISALPDWMKWRWLEQAVWQWIGLFMILIMGGLLFGLLLKWYGRFKRKESYSAWRLNFLLPPVLAMGLCWFLQYFVNYQINITGMMLSIAIMGFEFIFFLLSAWTILVGGQVAMLGIITSNHIKEDALDADVIRLVCRLISFALVFIVFYHAGTYFGLPVAAIFTSAGIAGVAVALAARETLANFFGGISIFLDRPFRTGDFIILDKGERGEVKAVGMRSTRILTRDDILITIPNSVITNIKIVNQSMPQQHYRLRIKMGIAYGTDLEQMERALVEEAQCNPLVMKTPSPRVRLLNFGESAINMELQVWAIKPHVQGRLTHELCKAIYSRFCEEGIKIPFPQLDIHLHHKKDNLSLPKKENAQ